MEYKLLSLRLFGTPACRRYQRMRTAALEVAAELGLEVELEEINDTDRLAQSNPLDLPRLAVNGEVIVSRNPPKVNVLRQKLLKFIEQSE
ncbi:MAG: hypothetical protein Kow002_06920 [Anaerolineales bacterium]